MIHATIIAHFNAPMIVREDTDMSDARNLIDTAIESAGSSLGVSGDWLTAVERVEAVAHVRDARTNELDQRRREAISPNAVSDRHDAGDHLVAAAVEVVHRIASDPGRLTKAWAVEMIEALGEEFYTELVGIAATTAALDMFAWATHGGDADIALEPVATGTDKPAQVRPDGVADVGAWVSQSESTTMANVSRSLSLVPVTNAAWVDLVQALYSRGPEFLDLAWERALSRPQVELVAARTTAELECFY